MKSEWERIPGWILLVCVLRSFPWGFRNFRMNDMEPLYLRSSSHSPISHQPEHILIKLVDKSVIAFTISKQSSTCFQAQKYACS